MQNRRSNRFYNHRLLITGLFLLLSASAGCTLAQRDIERNETVALVTGLTATASGTVVPPSTIPIPSRISTLMSTIAASPTATPGLTNTTTPSPTSTPTATSTDLPTLTPLPTIEPHQRGQIYANLMSNNGGCELPCWWGFELGVTSLNEVRQFYMAFDTYFSEQAQSNGISILYAQFVDPQIEGGRQVRHSFIAQDGIVIEAEIEIVHDPNYQVKSLLERLGQPSEVWMWTIPDPYEGILPARFRLYFPGQGVFVVFATGGVKIDDAVHICFDDDEGTVLHLWDPAIWDPDGGKGIVDRADQSGSAFRLEGHPIDEVSNWNVDQFYTILTNPNHTECLETPSDLWPEP